MKAQTVKALKTKASNISFGVGVVTLLYLAIFAGYWVGTQAAQLNIHAVIIWPLGVIGYVGFACVLWHMMVTTIKYGGGTKRLGMWWCLLIFEVTLFLMAASVVYLSHTL